MRVQFPVGAICRSVVPLARGGFTLLFAAWVGYYVISGSPHLSLRVFGPTVTLHALTAAAVILYLLFLSFRRRLPGPTFLDWPVLAVLLAYGAATAASINWRVSLEATLTVAMAVLVFCIAADRDLLNARQVLQAFLLVMAAAAAYALFEVGRDYWDWVQLARAVEPSWGPRDLLPPTVPRVHGVGDHENMLAVALTLAVPFYVLGLLVPGRWFVRLASAGGLVLLVVALFFTLSRAGWVAAAVAAALCVAGWGLVARPDLVGALRLEAIGRRGARLVLLGIGLVATLAVLTVVLVLATRWESRPEWLFRGSLSPRLDAMAAGGEMFRDRPLLGTGPATYGFMYAQYSGDYPVHAVHSHNGYLQAADDLGLAGVGVMLVVAVAAGAGLWRGYRRAPPEKRLLLVACVAATTGFLVHSLADAPNLSKTALVPLAIVLALMVRAAQDGIAGGSDGDPRSEEDRARARPMLWAALRLARVLPPVTVLVALVAVLYFWSNLDGPHHRYSQGLDDANAGRWLEAVNHFEQAADGDPDFALYQLQLGLSETMAYVDGGDLATGVRGELLERGIGHLERGLQLEPRSAIGNANLARAYLMADCLEEAGEAAEEAIRWAGKDAVVILVAAGVLEDAGAAEEAREAYAAAVSLDAGLAVSEFWSGSAFRRQSFEEIVARSLLPLNPCLIGQQLPLPGAPTDVDLAKAADGCRLFVLGQPGNVEARVDLATILIVAGGSDEALDILEDAVARHPDDGAVRRGLGEWYSEAGDLDRARHEWLLGAQLEDPVAALLLGDSYAPAPVPEEVVSQAQEIVWSGHADLTVHGVQSYQLGILYYRMKFFRESPVLILVPGEWQQALGGPYAALRAALGRWQQG